ncbi:Transcriptional activator flo8 [Trapelia coarctata]|nr:Transcriptional activator flo8 [Trapelia coarctata]
MAGPGTSIVETLLEKIVGDGLARKHRQSMLKKRQEAHIANLLTSSNPEDVVIGLMGEAQMRSAPSLNRTLSTVSSTLSVETKHTRSNTQPSTCSAPSTKDTSPTSSTNPVVSFTPPGYVRQIKDRQPIFYSTKDITDRIALADRSSYATTDIPVKEDIYGKTAWIGYGPNPQVDFPVHPDEMAGEGCYRISGHASGEELIECFKERIYPLGPLITSLVGDVEIRGLNFTYDELMHEIYCRTSARKHRNPDEPFYETDIMEDGSEVHLGFPCQPRPLVDTTPRVLGHQRTEWYAQDPTAREFNFIHVRYHPEPSDSLEVKLIAVPRKLPIVKGRADTNATKAKADGQSAELAVHARFANKSAILGDNSTVLLPNTTKHNPDPHTTGTPVKIAKMATQTDNIACGAIQAGGHITKLGTAPHQTHNTPSLLSKEHPLFGRIVQKGSLEPRQEPNYKRLTDVQEVDEDTDRDDGPWEDICVEKNPDINDRKRGAENANTQAKPKYRPVRPSRPRTSRTLTDNRPLQRTKSQQQVRAQAHALHQERVRIQVEARQQALAQKRAQDQKQAQDQAPGCETSRVCVQFETMVRKIHNPIQSEISHQARSLLQEQIKGPANPTSMAHIQKQVQGQIEALVEAQVGQHAQCELLGDEVRDRVLSQFQAHVPPAVQPQRLPHQVTVQGFHRTFTRIRIPAADEDASSDALESCS